MDDQPIEGEVADAQPPERLPLGSLIRSYRRYARWSQQELGREAIVDADMLQRIEVGRIRRPHNATLERLAGAFGRRFEHVTAQEIYADLVSARDSLPFTAAPDPAALLISARLRPYSAKVRRIAYDALNALLDAFDALSDANH